MHAVRSACSHREEGINLAILKGQCTSSEFRAVAHYVRREPGGRGIREACELILASRSMSKR